MRFALRHVRIPSAAALAFCGRVLALADEFNRLEPIPGAPAYGLLAAEMIGSVSLYLVSDESAYVAGSELVIDGGFAA